MKTLTNKQIKHLKGLGHHLPATLWIGKDGSSEQVVKELKHNFISYELIKVKVLADTRDEFQDIITELDEKSDATLVATIGKTALFYKPSDSTNEHLLKKSKIVFP